MATEFGDIGDGAAGGRRHKVEVLVVDADTQYLIELLNRLDLDADEIVVHTSTDVEDTIERVENDRIDCLLITYAPDSPEGLDMLDYMREHPLEIPVVLLPDQEATIIDSRNLAVDIASVFPRDDVVDDGVLGPHLVNLAEQNRVASEADRRADVQGVMQKMAHDIATAESPTEVDERVLERISETAAFESGWVAPVGADAEDIQPRLSTAANPTDLPGIDDDGLEDDLQAAARRALEYDQPAVAQREDVTYAVVPVSVDADEDRAVGLSSASRYAFHEGELDLLAEIGRTLGRTMEGIVTRRSLKEQVEDLDLFEEVLMGLGVGVVVYDEHGSIEQVNETFAEAVGEPIESIRQEMAWNVVPSLSVSTFDDRWETMERGDSTVATTTIEPGADGTERGTEHESEGEGSEPVVSELAGAAESPGAEPSTGHAQGGADTPDTAGPREYEVVTTRVSVEETPYMVTVLVESRDEAGIDQEFADLLGYEFRHWLEIAEEAIEDVEAGDEEKLQLVDEIVERMRDTVEAEIDAVSVRAGASPAAESTSPDELPSGGGAQGAGPEAAGPGGDTDWHLGEGELQVLGEVARMAWHHVIGEAGDYQVRGSSAVYADRGMLLRLFEHLFRTLYHYADGQRSLDLGLMDDGFYIEDDGAGTAHTDRAYAGAWQDATTDQPQGAGIRVAHRLATRLGWEMVVTENEAGGTRFEITGARVVAVEDGRDRSTVDADSGSTDDADGGDR